MLDESRVHKVLSAYNEISQRLSFELQSLSNYQSKIDKLSSTLELLTKSEEALKAVKPLIRDSSLTKCLELCNIAMRTIFESSDKVEYDYASQRFILNKGEYTTDLVDGEGGGYLSVLSFIISVFVLLKAGKRRIMFLDEQFTQISAKYFPQFLMFLRQLSHDLGIDILLVSHDQRISIDDVDHCYLIESGTSKQLK